MTIYLPQKQNPWQQMIPQLVGNYAQALMTKSLKDPTVVAGDDQFYKYDSKTGKMVGVGGDPKTPASLRRKTGSTRTYQVGSKNITEEWTGAGWEQIGEGSKWKPGMSLEDRMVFRQEMTSIRDNRNQLTRQIMSLNKLPNLKIYEQQKAMLPELKEQLSALTERERNLKEVAFNINLKPKPKKVEPKVKVMEEMPSASEHKGRTLVDDVTGKEYKSDGTNWVEVK